MNRMSAAAPIFQVKIGLLGVSKPPVWRRLLVPGALRLDRFHEAIQAAMGWEDYHMHVFSTASREYGVADPELEHHDERRVTLADVLVEVGDRIRYTYDFGDDWEHAIVLEKVLVAVPGTLYPTCVAGKSACPPEDCGGVWAYAELRDALADPTHPEHAEMVEWLELEQGSDFDPKAFDLEAVNESLAGLGAIC